MRTRLFSEFSVVDEHFLRDLNALWEMPKEKREQLVPFVRSLQFAETVKETRTITDEAVAAIDHNRGALLKAIKTLRFLQLLWNPIANTPADLIEDMHDLELIPKDKIEEAEDFFRIFFQSADRDIEERLKRNSAASLLPCYTSINSIVDMRTVFRSAFGVDDRSVVESYEPDCIGFVPVAVIEIRRDSGDPKYFHFQLEESSLRRLIDNLRAVLKEIEYAKAVFDKE